MLLAAIENYEEIGFKITNNSHYYIRWYCD
jgi:hypothetical protein